MPVWLFGSLRGYRTAWLRGDLVAGLTVWAVLVPEALAYASIAGVSPVIGLYAAPGALVLYAVFGSSRQLIVGPMSATAALSAAAVGDYAAHGSGNFVTLTAALAVTTGVAALLAGVLRLGFVANFISEPVLKGFIIGLALTIMIGQVPKLLGIEKGSGDFFQKLWAIITHLGDLNVLTLLIGLVSLVIVLGLRRFAPQVPGSLAAVAFGVICVAVFGLDHHGVAIVGHIDRGLASVGVPDTSFQRYLTLAGSSVAIMLVGFSEGLGAAKTYAARQGYEVDPDRELVGLGAANLAAGFCSGMVVNGSLSKTAVNGTAGARSQISGLVVAAMTIVTLLLLTGLFEKLPETTLAAVVIAAVWELVDLPALRRLYGVYSQRLGRAYGVAARPDFLAAIAALLGVTVFDTLPGLFIGIAVSMLLLLYRASRPPIVTLGRGPDGRYRDLDRHPDTRTVPGVVILRVDAGMFFANADWVRTRIQRAAMPDNVDAVILDAQDVPYIDVTAVHILEQLHRELEHRHVRLLVARDIGQVRDVIRHASHDPLLTQAYPTIQAAVDAARGRR